MEKIKNKEKYLRNQAREERRGLYERERKKRNQQLRLAAHNRFRGMKKRVKKQPAQKGNLLLRIRMFLTKAVRKIKCLIGLHSWVLRSGLPGTPKYLCPRCMKLSRQVWEKKE